MKRADDFLQNEFKIIKNKTINQLLEKINSLESSYEQCYQRNKEIITLMQTLIENYDGSAIMKENIIENSHINQTQCKTDANINEIISYYNNFYIVNVRGLHFNNIKEKYRKRIYKLSYNSK